MMVHEISDPTLSSRTHERGYLLILIFAQLPDHVKIALDPIWIGTFWHHTDSSSCEPRKYDLRGAFAMICSDCKDLIRLTVSFPGNSHVLYVSKTARIVFYLWIFQWPGAFAIGDRWC
jgi:hypothetical protein